jgi:hypothetical protein
MSPEEASSWRRVRKYAVPRAMIAQATQRRLAGDWQGACAAGRLDVAFDLGEVGRTWGTSIRDALRGDLEHLAPDLLRWHLPRYLRGRTTLQPDRLVVIAAYARNPADGPLLYLTSSKMVDGPQRLTLCFGRMETPKADAWWRAGRMENWIASPHLWDARRAGDLLARCGGGQRAPFLHADGTLLRAGELPEADPGPGDPARRAEWMALLAERGKAADAYRAAGIELDETPPAVKDSRYRSFGTAAGLREVLGEHRLDLSRLEPEVRRLEAAGVGLRFQVPHSGLLSILVESRSGTGLAGLFRAPAGGLRVRLGYRSEVRDWMHLPEACWRRLPDIDLLRDGMITIDQLHPLVSASLAPGRAPRESDGPPDLRLPPAVRVRCRGQWHEVLSHAGRLVTAHSDEEVRRERALRAFGGPVTGCFAVQQAWTSGSGRLPRALREQRNEFFQFVQHGDTAAVVRLLDAGVDPGIRDGRQRTLLHALHLLDWQVLLPRLLTEGLDIEARDHRQRTPLHVAAGEGPEALVRALLDAGARPDVIDHEGSSLISVIVYHKRMELKFLHDAILRDHPGLAVRRTPWGNHDEQLLGDVDE